MMWSYYGNVIGNSPEYGSSINADGIWGLSSVYFNTGPTYRDLTGYPTSITLSGSDTASRAFCFDHSRDGSIWIDENDNTLAKYVWVSGTTFIRDSTISLDTTASGTNGGLVLGLSDNGTDLFFATGGTVVGENGRIISVNKSTGVTTLHASSISSGNSQGALWDGTNFYVGSFDTQYSYRVSTDLTSLTELSYLFPTVMRGATYDYDNSLYYFSTSTIVYRCSISGNTLSVLSSYARTNGAADEIGYINGLVYEQDGNTIVAP